MPIFRRLRATALLTVPRWSCARAEMVVERVLAEHKRAMRAHMRAVVRALPPDAISAASVRACERVLGALGDSQRVSVYLAMAKECETAHLLDQLFARALTVYIPKVDGSHRESMRMLRIESREALSALPLNRWGIPEPSEAAPATMGDGLCEGVFEGVCEGVASPLIDAVVVPAMAFDRRCMRLGHGKGYYDTYLDKLQAARRRLGLPAARMIGLGLQEQIVDTVPTEAHDVPLDCVCLPEEIVYREG